MSGKSPVRLDVDRRNQSAFTSTRNSGRPCYKETGQIPLIAQQRIFNVNKGAQRDRCHFPFVSKIGFFLCPSELVPLDSYAVKGLKNLRRASGSSPLLGRFYREYLVAFNEQHARMEQQLVDALKEPWCITVANKPGCPENALTTIALRRKVLDNDLMLTGDYLSRQPKKLRRDLRHRRCGTVRCVAALEQRVGSAVRFICFLDATSWHQRSAVVALRKGPRG